MADNLDLAALDYHEQPKPGKLAIVATKPMDTQRDLALAYSPGVAAACRAIAGNPRKAATVTARQNLVAVITDGSAVLGLGDIGPLAAKPVMEGKAVLFKKFAGIDVFDLELAQPDPEKLIDAVACLEPTFGGILLEDIERLTNFVYTSSSVMRPVFEKAKRAPKRLVYAEGEERKVLQAAQQVSDEGIAFPLLVGRPDVIEQRIEQLGLRLSPGRDCEIVDMLDNQRYAEYCALFHQRARRLGVSVQESKALVRTDTTVAAALMVEHGDADAMLCGTVGRFRRHLERIRQIIGLRKGVRDFSALTALILPTGAYFICDTHVTPDPTADEIVEMTLLAAAEVRAFGMTPRVALLSRSHFGTHNSPTAIKMRAALHRLQEHAPDLIVEGEMNGETAVSEDLRMTFFGESVLKGPANLLVMPNDDAAHISYSLLKVLGGGVAVGPILVGAAKPAHIVTQTTLVRGLVNMSAISVAEAQLGGKKRAPLLARTV